MADFVPVDHDPFATPSGGSGLVPVDHDPFATQHETTAGSLAKQAGIGAGEGLLDTVTAPFDQQMSPLHLSGLASAYLVSKATGVEPKKWFGPGATPMGDVWKGVAGKVGLNPEDYPAQSTGEKFAREAGKGAGAMAIPMGGPRRAAQVLGDLTMGAIGGVTGEAAADVVPEEYSPYARMAGNVVGGVGSALGWAGAKAGARGVASAVRDYTAPMTEAGQQRMAAQTVADRATDLPAVRQSVEQPQADLVPGSKPTVFQQTGDMGLGSLEREVATRDPAAFTQLRAEQNAARLSALHDLQTTGNPEAVPELLNATMRDIDVTTQRAVDQATQEAQQSAQAIGGTLRPDEYGNTIRTALRGAEDRARANERQLWKAVDPDGTLAVHTQPIQDAVERVYGNMTEAAGVGVSPVEAQIRKVVEGYRGVEPFREMTDLRSLTSAALRQELISAGRTPTYARLAQLRGAIEDSINSTVAGRATQEAQAVATGTLHPTDTIASRLQGEANEWTQGGRGAESGAQADTAAREAAVSGPSRTQVQGGPGGQAGAQGVSGGERIRAATVEVGGKVYEGANHVDAITAAARDLGITADELLQRPLRDGFITDAGRVVDRAEAMRIGNEQGQTNGRASRTPGELTTEDLRTPQTESVHDMIKRGAPYEAGPGMREGEQADLFRPERQELEPNFDADARERLTAATTATRERAQTFGAQPVKGVLRREGQQGPYTTPESLVPSRIFKAGDGGGDAVRAFRRAAGDDQALATLGDYAASDLRQSAMNPDGTLDPGKFLKWQSRHAEAMRAFPDLARQFGDAAVATETIATAAAARREAMDAYREGAVGRLLPLFDRGDVVKTIGGIFGTRNAMQTMQRLATEARGNPAAMEGLRKAVAEHITNRLISNTEAGTSGQALVRADQFQNFVRQNEPVLRQVFSPEEVASLKAVAADIQRANRSRDAVRIPGQSNTAQDLTALARNEPKASVFSKIVPYAGAVAADLALTGGLSSMSIAGIFGARTLNAMRDAGMVKVNDLIRDAMLDPATMRLLLQKLPAARNPGYDRALASRITRLATVAPMVEQKRAHGGRVNPQNIDQHPTEAQKKAENYAKDHVRVHGLDISIENAKGHERSGVGKDGKRWSVTMPAHYGYFKRTEGKDGDHVDVYLGPHLDSDRVFIVDQVDAKTKRFDEHKVMLGFRTKGHALTTYRSAFSDGRGGARIGHVTEMSVADFKNWLKNGDQMKPAKLAA